MIRRALKTAVASGLHASGAHRLLGRMSGRAGSPLLPCYHRVVENLEDHPESAPAMFTSIETFERQIDWIGKHFDFVGLDEVIGEIDRGRRGGRPTACITFDDGYADVFHNAIPLLWRKGIPAACFVVTAGLEDGAARLQHDELIRALRSAVAALGEVRARELFARSGVPAGLLGRRLLGRLSPVALCETLLVEWPHVRVSTFIERLRREVGPSDEIHPPSDRSPLMTASMLRELSAAGFEIGSHTRTHRILPLESEEVMREELIGSKRSLEQVLGQPVRHLAYPNGRFDDRTVRSVAAAGYEYAYTTCAHRHPTRPLLTISRQCLWERSATGASGSFSEPVASCHVHGVFELLRRCRSDHGLPASEARGDLPSEPARLASNLDLVPWTTRALEATRAGSLRPAGHRGMRRVTTGDRSDG